MRHDAAPLPPPDPGRMTALARAARLLLTGLILAIEGEGLSDFVEAASAAVLGAPSQTMLTAGIRQAYEHKVEDLGANGAVATLACANAAFFETTAEHFVADAALGEEVFGPASLLVRCRDEADLANVLKVIEGQLTATLQMEPEDEELAARMLPLLERKAGRILANGWPTGVEVAHAMVHGGPFPATSDGRTTSVGSLAIDRYLRPVSYQNLPQAVLPPELRDDATAAPRLVDGKLTLG